LGQRLYGIPTEVTEEKESGQKKINAKITTTVIFWVGSFLRTFLKESFIVWPIIPLTKGGKGRKKRRGFT